MKMNTMIRLFGAFLIAVSVTNVLPIQRAHATLSSTAASSVSYASGFDGLSELNNTVATGPPDVQVAAGPTYIMEMVNAVRAVYNKQGLLIVKQSLSSFFNIVGTDFISDPKVIYDSPSSRWYASILDLDSNSTITRSNVLVAVSANSDPTGSWKIYNTISTGANVIPDQPFLGVSSDKLVVSANVLNGSTTSLLGAQWWVFNKSDLVNWAVSPGFWSSSRNATLSSVYPVQSLSTTNTEYMVSTGSDETGVSSANSVQLFSITGVPPGVTTSPQVVLELQNPIIKADGAGEEPCYRGIHTDQICPTIDAGDQRVLDAAFYQGKLWLSADEACPLGAYHTCIRLIQIDTGTTSIRQDIDYGSTTYDFYYPALRIDNSGNLAVVYGLSSKFGPTFPSLAITGQMAGDPPGSLAPARTIRSGSNDETSPSYGDYFGAAVDPSDSSVVWVAGEYHGALTGNCTDPKRCWSTFIDKMRVYGPVNFAGDTTFKGVRVRTTGILHADARLDSGTFSGSLAVLATNSTTGQTLFSKSYTLASASSKFLLNIAVAPYLLSSDATITSASGNTFTPVVGVTRNIDINANGVVDQPDMNSVSAAFGCNTGQYCYNPKADLNADGTVDIVDLSLVGSYFSVTDYV